MKQNEQPMQPFFAQFLDAQKASQETQNSLGTHPLRDVETQKYPSDNDDNPPQA